MKKIAALFIVFVLLFSFCGCNSASDAKSLSDSSAPEKNTVAQTISSVRTSSSIDVDLTALSGTMVYAEVYNMLSKPDDYLGKTVKMKGIFAVYEGTARNYYACLISDATACCSQGIEFVLDGDYTYPDNYPELDSEITVTGIFDTYTEEDCLYCQLINATLD